MQKKYFDINDNFEKIINEHIKGKKTISQIQTGWTNFVFRVSGNDGTYFFRFPRNNFFSKALIKEYHFNNFIKDKISFITPNLKIYYHNNRPYSIHSEIEGETLDECYNKLSNNEKQEVAQDIIKIIHQFSLVKINQVTEITFEKLSNFVDNLAMVAKNNYDLSMHDFLKELENENLICCHGDLNPGNIILKNKKVYGVIDFAFAGVSSNIVDFSRMIGRTPSDFKPMLIKSFEKTFNTTVNIERLDKIEKIWQYIEEKYILYIKQNHPTIILPSLV